MPTQPGDVTVIATLSIQNNAPAPIARGDDLLGGYRSVADITARDAIPNHLRQEGMLVYVEGATQWWLLLNGITNADWVLANFASGTPQEQIDTLSVPSDGFVTYTLSQTPSNPAAVAVEVNGVTYRASSGHFTVVGTTLTWLNIFFPLLTADAVVARYPV